MVGNAERHRRGNKVYRYRRYVCNTSYARGAGSCRVNAVAQEAILREIAAELKAAFSDPQRLRVLREELRRQCEQQDRALAKRRARIVERVAELGRQIDQGAERLLLCPADVQALAAAKLKEWQTERDRLACELAELDQAADGAEDFAQEVEANLTKLQHLEATIADAPADEVRDVVAEFASKITLHFEHGEEIGRGRRRTTLSYFDLELTPEAHKLLSATSR
jgi:hypothetical protein